MFLKTRNDTRTETKPMLINLKRKVNEMFSVSEA